MAVDGTARPTPTPLRALPIRIISTLEKMLARPIRRKERKKMIPERMIESFLPAQFIVQDERQLPRIAPMGGRDTTHMSN